MSFFEDKKYRKMLGYMGTVSGRDEDKIEKEYQNNDYHTMNIGEITKILKKVK